MKSNHEGRIEPVTSEYLAHCSTAELLDLGTVELIALQFIRRVQTLSLSTM